ncbi:hypothetical protein Tco_0278480 [Tanacetum coccineum]
MVAYLKKTDGNAEFHEIVDFLTRSFIHHALTVSPIVSTTFVEQFWTSAKSKIINNVRHITAKVAGKPVSISEASIRSDLLFDDANGIDSLPNQAIFDAIQLMGYEGDLTVLTFNKALFSPQWRFLFHTMNHCISSKSTSWDQILTNIATAVICLTSTQKYNFSKLIFDGMLRHLDAKKKFVMYPCFISIFLDKQLANVPVPLDHFLVNALTSNVFSFMVKKGKHFSGNVTPLFASMLVQPTEDEGALSERPSEAQPTPSPPHSSEAPVSDQAKEIHQAKEIQHLKAQIKKLKKQAKPVVKLHRAWMNSASLKQRLTRKRSSKKQWVHRESIPEDSLDYIEIEDAQDEGRTRDVVDEEKENAEDVLSIAQQKVSTDKEKVSTDRPIVSTDRSKVSTDRQKDSTDDQNEGTDEQSKGTNEHTEEGRATQTTQPPTSIIFGNDETIAQVLLNMSQAKVVLREKEKGVEFKDIEETERLRPTSTRSLLTLKPLPKIDPKDKGKKKIEEEDDEFESESDGIPEAKKKFKQLVSDEEMARKARIEADRLLVEKLQEKEREQFTIEERAKFLHDIIVAQRKFLAQQRSEAIRNIPPTKNQLRNQMMTYLKHVGNFKHSDLKTKKFEEIQALYEKIKSVKEEDKEEEGTKKRKGGHIKMIARKKARKQSDVDSISTQKFTLDGFELILWGDLKIMMESSTEGNEQSDFWSGQQDVTIRSIGGCMNRWSLHTGIEMYSYSKCLLKEDISLSTRFIARWRGGVVDDGSGGCRGGVASCDGEMVNDGGVAAAGVEMMKGGDSWPAERW